MDLRDKPEDDKRKNKRKKALLGKGENLSERIRTIPNAPPSVIAGLVPAIQPSANAVLNSLAGRSNSWADHHRGDIAGKEEEPATPHKATYTNENPIVRGQPGSQHAQHAAKQNKAERRGQERRTAYGTPCMSQ
jgi:hypothetical protein